MNTTDKKPMRYALLCAPCIDQTRTERALRVLTGHMDIVGARCVRCLRPADIALVDYGAERREAV